MHFWHAILFSETLPIDSQFLACRDRLVLEVDRRVSSVLESENVVCVKDALEDVAPRILFDIALKGSDLQHSKVEDDILTIYIPETVLTDLWKASEDPDPTLYTWRSFALAKQIIQDFARAIRQSADSVPSTHYFPFKNFAELGLEWENSVFGGIISITANAREDVRDEVLFFPWPSSALPLALETKSPRFVGLRGRLPPFERRGQLLAEVAFAQVERLFREDFWEEEVVRRGAWALRPEIRCWHRIKPWKRKRTDLGLETVVEESREVDEGEGSSIGKKRKTALVAVGNRDTLPYSKKRRIG